VVIIRGGGSTADLVCFDSYALALNCAQFPMPIITGIGHQRDVSVLDMVAHLSLKTPTAVASFLVARLQDAAGGAVRLVVDIHRIVSQRIENEYNALYQIQSGIKQALRGQVIQKTYWLDRQKNRLQSQIALALLKEKNKLLLLEKDIERHSPVFLLRGGYSITTVNGKRITSIGEVKAGDRIRTWMNDGSFESQVNS